MEWYELLCRKLATELADIMRHCRHEPFEVTETAFKRLERELRNEAEEFALVVKRRIAENMFDAARYKDLPTNDCKMYFERLVRVGFENIEREGCYRVIFARYLISVGEERRAVKMLDRFRRKYASQKVNESERERISPVLSVIEQIIDEYL